MPLFGRSRAVQPDDELLALRRSIQSRGMAKIDEARIYVDRFLGEVAQSSEVAGNSAGEAWLRDRLRMMMVVGWANWFGILDRVPEGTNLRAEWHDLIADPIRFGPEHLVAWWWNVSESLFRPTIDNQLAEMRGALRDGAAQLRSSGRSFTENMVDWTDLLKPRS